jgi:hypothetical protein
MKMGWFDCAVCGNEKASITSMGFVVQNYCDDCYKNRREDCDAAFKRDHDIAVKREAYLPEVKDKDIDVKADYLQYMVMAYQEPELGMLFEKIARKVYEIKIHNYSCAKNWRWNGWNHVTKDDQGKYHYNEQAEADDFVKEAVPFCYDRLQTYDAGRATAIDYFTAACAGVYEQAKLKNWQDWAY